MRHLPATLMLLAIAAAADERIVEESPLGQVLVERTLPDGSSYRYWTPREAFDERAEREERRQATRRRQCENKLANLQRALDNLRETERKANAGCPDGDELCEQLREVNERGLPNQESYAAYARKEANLVCDSAVMGSARSQALPADLETAARDVLLEALRRVLGARP